jgi:hypothetical protein
MATIGIYEDSVEDIIEKYGSLAKVKSGKYFREHDLQIMHYGKLFPEDKTLLEASGIDTSKVYEWNLEMDNVPWAHVYFVDGLGGYHWRDVIDSLPENKPYLYTGDGVLRQRAKDEGYFVVNGQDDLEGIVLWHDTSID